MLLLPTVGEPLPSAIPSFFVAGNLQPQIRILIPRYSSCESCGTGFCVVIIADEGASFQKPRFRSLDLTLKGRNQANFKMRGFMREYSPHLRTMPLSRRC